MESATLALAIESHKAQLRANPLDHFKWASEAQGEFGRYVTQGVECVHQAGNWAGKTKGGAAYFLGIAEGRTELDGVPLPRFARPTNGAILVPTYKQQVASSQKAVLDLLGDYQHEPSYLSRAENILSGIKVKHPFGDSWIHFISQENSRPESIWGQRWDWVWGDENPKEAFWREARKNAKYRGITYTPLRRADWEWVALDFDGCEGAPRGGRVVIRSTVHDNRYLSREFIEGLIQSFAGDVHKKARIFGDYVDDTGLCPLNYDKLQAMLEHCRPGEPWAKHPQVELWGGVDPGETCLVLLDPSGAVMGRDRAGLWGVAASPLRRPRLFARVWDYVQVHDLAQMGIDLAHASNTALLVPEMNGGWGDAMMPTIRDYPNLYRELGIDTVTQRPSNRIGWYQTETTKGLVIGALQRGIEQGGIEILSRECIESYMRLTMDERGKVVRKLHQNHEDMVLGGMACHILETMPAFHTPAPRNEHPFDRAIRRDMGWTKKRRPVHSGGGDWWR